MACPRPGRGPAGLNAPAGARMRPHALCPRLVAFRAFGVAMGLPLLRPG